jgi:hypothetical protein
VHTSEDLRRYAATQVSDAVAEREFREGFLALLAGAPPGLVREFELFSVPAESTWIDTGLDLEPGDAVTLFVTGRVVLPPEIDTEMSPDQRLCYFAAGRAEERRAIWYRVGDDDRATRGTRTSHTFVAAQAGRLAIAGTPIGDPPESADDQVKRNRTIRPRLTRCVLVVRWTAEPLEGLRELRAGGDVSGFLDSEIARLSATPVLPTGWVSPMGAESELFTADLRHPDAPIIGCYSNGGGGLIQKDAELPFLPGTTLRWAWRVDQLASSLAEDALALHDYMSIAVEFDDGRDLTYYWSGALPVETAYRCPVPGWEDHETHIVVRTGPQGLGEWLDEERDLYADFARHVGDPPAKVVRVWLLASTQRQPSEARCDFGLIELANDRSRVRVN